MPRISRQEMEDFVMRLIQELQMGPMPIYLGATYHRRDEFLPEVRRVRELLQQRIDALRSLHDEMGGWLSEGEIASCDGCNSPPDDRRWCQVDGRMLCRLCENAVLLSKREAS